MNCKKCGYILGPGQSFCPNCKEYNSPILEANNPPAEVVSNSQVNINQTTEYQTFEKQTNMYQTNSIPNSNYVYAKPKKSIFKKILLIIIMVIVVRFLIIFVISAKNTAEKINKSYNNMYISRYNILLKSIRTEMLNNQQLACEKEQCASLYSFVSTEIVDITIKDNGDHYQIIFEANKNYENYGKINFTEEDCKNLKDAVCEKKRIIGKIYKQN